MTVSDDGNLVVLNGKNEVLWSSNVTNGVQNSSALLTDDGNLVLQDKTNGNTVWESFQQPSNVLARNMRLTAGERAGKNIVLRSWNSHSDPYIGSFSVGIDDLEVPEAFVWNGSRPYWQSGPWNGRIFIGIP
ncbi:hypothetical protein RCOM_1096910 [Ricinus communis]|uniref:Bulb-type lectin domain-containing protein n=1 Tax=Ricinus communis TaxID=3988 RepID=B9SFE9_RICCO|nr:hypothetical protein RCOM_1096910 [Ricinus communis]